MRSIGQPFSSATQAIASTIILSSVSAVMAALCYDNYTTNNNHQNDYLLELSTTGVIGLTGLAINNCISYFYGND